MKVKEVKLIGLDSLQYNILKRNLQEALDCLNLQVEISEVTDENNFADYKLRNLPALVVNDKVLLEGVAPATSQLELLLIL